MGLDFPRAWTEQEKWVWEQVSIGRIADFNVAQYGGKLDPKRPEGWTINRMVDPTFLRTILLEEPFRSALTEKGVRIVGARIVHPIDLYNVTLAHQLGLDGCRIEADVDLDFLRTPYAVSLQGSKITGSLTMQHLHVGQNLLMREGSEFSRVVLTGATIEGDLSMYGSKFPDAVEMDGITIGENLFMHEQAEFANVYLTGAKVRGVLSMSGSNFTGQLSMDRLEAGQDLQMHEANFQEVFLTAAKIGGHLIMDGSTFLGPLHMDNLQVNGNVSMSRGANFSDIVLSGARIENVLIMDGGRFTGSVDMNRIFVGGSLSMCRGAEFNKVELAAAKVESTVGIEGSKFTGRLNMDSLRVGQHLLMRDRAEFNEVFLAGAEIGGNVKIVSSTFNGKLDMNSIQVGRHLILRDSQVTTDSAVILSFAKIGNLLDLSGSTLPGAELTGTKVHGELRLGSGSHHPVRWKEHAKMILRNAEVGSLQDLQEAWPGELDLSGLTYLRFGGSGSETITDAASRDVSWFTDWLAKQKLYSPQPYEQLADVLTKAGYNDKANEVLYAGRERERGQTKGRTWLWLTILKGLIGYGYRPSYALVWALVLIATGAIVLRISHQGPDHGMPYGLAYSFDMLLPLIRLRESHYGIGLDGWVRYYFYFHKIMGYVLASFLIAGLTGLTKGKTRGGSD